MKTRSGSKYTEEGPLRPAPKTPESNAGIKPKPKPKSPAKTPKSTKKVIESKAKSKEEKVVKEPEVVAKPTTKPIRRGRSVVVKEPPKEPPKALKSPPKETPKALKSPPKETPKPETTARSTRSRRVVEEIPEVIETKSPKKSVKSRNTTKTEPKKEVKKAIDDKKEEVNEVNAKPEETVEEKVSEKSKPVPKSSKKAIKPPAKKRITKKRDLTEQQIEPQIDDKTEENSVEVEKESENKETAEEVTKEKEVSVEEETTDSQINDKKEQKIPEIDEKKVSEEEEEMETNDESSSLKRKSDETDVPTAPETSKRIRLHRFDVPSIPFISGFLYSFGSQIAGELGERVKRFNETKIRANEPSIVNDRDGQYFGDVVDVVCGAMHSICLTSSGKVYSFGCNDDLALGRDTKGSFNETDGDIEEVEDADESEEREARALKEVMGLPPIVKLTAGDMHTCALSESGSVYVWGNFKDESKKFGLFVDSVKSEGGDDFTATPHPKRLELETKIVDIASGCHHILLLTEDGNVLSFGEGSKGQLGRISSDDLQSIATNRKLFLKPTKVEFEGEVTIEKVWANHWSSYAKTTSGDILVWGLNNYHQLGFKSTGSVEVSNADPNESQQTQKLIIELTPVRVEKMPKNVIMIANGQHHLLALDSDGRVFSCGSNTYGKLGFTTENTDDPTVDTLRAISEEAFEGQAVSYITCGEFCSFAITESGHLYAWGQGSAHIGSDHFNDIVAPTRVKGSLADTTRFVRVSSGSQHSLLSGVKTAVNGN